MHPLNGSGVRRGAMIGLTAAECRTLACPVPLPVSKNEAITVLRLIGHRKAVRCVAYSPMAPQIASGSEDGTLRLWSVAGGTQQAEAAFDD